MSPRRRLDLNVRRAREVRHWTQEDLAARAKLHRVSLARIEAGRFVPRLTTLERIAKALGVPVTELLR